MEECSGTEIAVLSKSVSSVSGEMTGPEPSGSAVSADAFCGLRYPAFSAHS